MTNKTLNKKSSPRHASGHATPASRPNAFSLVEVAAIIVIIGILIAGVVAADKMVSKFRRAAAKTLAISSPINSIRDTALWLETSLDNGFNPSEDEDGAALTAWYDQQSSGSPKVSVVAVGTGPTYANTINRVHAVKFSGSASNYLKIADASFLNNTDYTIFVTEKRQAANAGYFLSTTNTSNTVDNKLVLGYVSDGVIAHSHNSTNYTVAPKVSTYANSTEKARTFVFIQDSTLGKKTYINGILAAQDSSNTSQLSGVTTLAIGLGYTGEIGEIAIFTKALKDEERRAVEDYSGKKWTRPILRDTYPSCINGTVTDTYCDNACTVSVTGVSTPSSVASGASGNLTCDNSLGYSGTVAYSCSNGSLNPTGSCAATTCTAVAGTGYAAQSGLAYAASGSGSFNCDTSTGYTGIKNYTCTTTGAATITGGTCTATTCTTGGGAGYSAKSNLAYAASGSGSFNCDVDYVGTINYTCTTTGAATITGGTCDPAVPSNSVAPTLSASSATVGTSISVSSNGTWSPTPTSYSYQWWWADGTPAAISGATSSSYTPVTGDTGHTLLCKVAAQNSTSAFSSPVSSNTTSAVTNPPVNSVAPALSTTSASFGTAITVSTGTWSPTPTSYSYQWWWADGTPAEISGATSSSYTPVVGDIGHTLLCKVVATSAGGTSVAVSSNTSLAVTAPCIATNGTNTDSGGYRTHTFTATSGTLTLNCPAARTADILVVGGGGAGSWGGGTGTGGGGGGGGGVVQNTAFSLTGDYTVTVGVGGSAGDLGGAGEIRQTSSSVSGSNTITAYPGEQGKPSGYRPANYASSGGGSGGSSSAAGNGGDGGTIYKNTGGGGNVTSYSQGAGGGGGGAGTTAAGNGASGNTATGGSGGSALVITMVDGATYTVAGGGKGGNTTYYINSSSAIGSSGARGSGYGAGGGGGGIRYSTSTSASVSINARNPPTTGAAGIVVVKYAFTP